jgi:hypothetical protein
MWPVGLVFGAMFAIFAAVAIGQISSMRGQKVDTVFDLMVVLFQGLWLLGWSVGVVILFLLTVVLLFYEETARIDRGRLIHVPRLGPLKVFVEYDLAKIRSIRVESTGADRARIRFDYRDREHGLGNDMPVADAERALHTIQSAIDSLGLHEQPSPSDAPEEQAPTAPSPRRDAPPQAEPAAASASSSALALVGANLIPLAGVLLLGWDLGAVMTLFWAENAVIGWYNLLKLGVVARWGILFVGPFFVGHYGGFMAGHFLFIYYLFVRGIGATGPEPGALAALRHLFVPLWPALLALLISHGVSFYTNFLRGKEYVGRTVAEQMAEPYKRVILLHVTIIFGGWVILLLKSPLPALALLVVLKTAMDLRAHRREHGSRA